MLGLSACVNLQGDKKQGDVNAEHSASDHEILFYWDNINLMDSAWLINSDQLQRKLSGFIQELSDVPDTIQVLAIQKMLTKASTFPDVFPEFFKEVERYLYNPNSSLRNDAYYEVALRFAIDSISLDSIDRTRNKFRLELVRKNQVGDPALDFSFELDDGTSTSLYALKSPYTLLFFYEPGCQHCAIAIRKMQGSSGFKRLLNEELLKVLAIYPFGDRPLWESYKHEIPNVWMNGIVPEAEIIQNKVYDVRATPTIYLLDEDKKVLLKDSDLTTVALFFSGNNI